MSAPTSGLLATDSAIISETPTTLNVRTQRLLHGAILPTLLRMAWPNVLVMLAQASTGLIETWWVSKLGTDALAGIALVFPGFMLMTMLSAGAIGGGISSAVARALGGGRRSDAEALVFHALVISTVLGLATSALFLIFGRSLYAAMGGRGPSLEAAMAYSNVVFAGNLLVWILNALASVLRGTGNMLVPAMAIIVGVVLLVPLSPVLIFGWGPLPALGIAGGGWAIVLTTLLMICVLAWYILSGCSLVSLRWTPLTWAPTADILRVGGVGAVSTLQTTLTVALTTALGGSAGGPDAVAGYGTAARLEYLLIPLVFGLGAPMVALVGTSIGAGDRQRALRIALTGGALSFAVTGTIGVAAAGRAAGVAFAVRRRPGHACCRRLLFADRWAHIRLLWSRIVTLFCIPGSRTSGLAAAGRDDPASHCGWRRLGRDGTDRIPNWAFSALAVGLVAYGSLMVAAIGGGAWFAKTPKPGT